MARVIAIANQKGGVGKTTTAINICASLGAANQRVLLIDMDPQGNATMGAGVDKNDLDESVYDILIDEQNISEMAIDAEQAGFDVIPSNSELTAAEIHLLDFDDREHRLGKAIKKVRGNYDFIFIDCPPSLNMLSLNSLAAADSVLIPMQCEYYALEGLTALMDTISQVKEAVNPQLEIEGLLRTMLDVRNRLAIDVSEELEDHFGELVFETSVPRNVRLAEAPSYGLPVMYHDIRSTGAQAYIALADEMINREQARQQLNP
ncbi:MAG: ParA family protein [Gammaproteobacteria bacterium]|nr:ParA family protein [Gammaproteobacteria bacterium]